MRLPNLPLVPEKASESMRGILYRKEKQWEQWSSRDGAIREASLDRGPIRDETDGHGLCWIFVAPHLRGHRATPSNLSRRKPVRSSVSFVSLIATRLLPKATRITARERPRRFCARASHNPSRPYRPYAPPRAPRAPRTFAAKGAAEPVSRNYQRTGLPARSSNDPRTLADIRPRRR